MILDDCNDDDYNIDVDRSVRITTATIMSMMIEMKNIHNNSEQLTMAPE